MELMSILKLAKHTKLSYRTVKNIVDKHKLKGYGFKYKKYDVQDFIDALSK